MKLVVLRREGLEDSALGRRKMRSAWEGWGGGFGGGYRLRMEKNVSCFFRMKFRESDKESICA